MMNIHIIAGDEYVLMTLGGQGRCRFVVAWSLMKAGTSA